MITPRQKNYLLALTKNLDKEIVNAALLAKTEGRTKELDELTMEEASNLIKFFSPASNDADLKRKKVLRYAHLLGWEKKGKVDMEVLNAFLVKKSGFGLELNELSPTQLDKVIIQLQTIHKKDVKQKKNDSKQAQKSI